MLHESEKTGKDDSQEGKKGAQKVFIIDQVHTFLNRKQEKRFWSADQKRFCHSLSPSVH